MRKSIAALVVLLALMLSSFTSLQASAATPQEANLVGHVSWQGITVEPSARQQQPLTIILKSTSREVTFSPQTDAFGSFTVSIADLENGTYAWWVKGSNTLANAGTIELTGASLGQDMGVLLAGDADNDNMVDMRDFNMMRNSFAKSLGQDGYDARADFNNDNVVNISDYTLIRKNFGIGGKILTAP